MNPKPLYTIASGPKQMADRTWKVKGFAVRELKRIQNSLSHWARDASQSWDVVTLDELRARDHEIEVVNMLSGKPCKIMASEEGSCCDPSTERYHSM